MRRFATAGVGLAILTTFAAARAASADDPSALVGTWAWTWKDAEGVTHKHKLEVEGTGDKVAASETFDDEAPVKVTDLKLADKKVSFSVLRGKRLARYSGTLKEDDLLDGIVLVSIEGQETEYGWEARRTAAEKKP